MNSLFKKISETMPPNGPNETTDEAKIDIVAFLLQSNGFPAGQTELALDPLALDRIEIVKKGLIATAPNFALVQVVGCLAQGPNNNGWVLTRTSEPIVTKDEAPSAGLLKTAAAKPLGDQTYQLVSVDPVQARSAQRSQGRGARPALPGSHRCATEPDLAADGRRELSELGIRIGNWEFELLNSQFPNF